MFTGLVETVGTVAHASGDSPRRLSIASSIPAEQTHLGDSVAIDGCCLTVVQVSGHAQGSLLSFEAATETLARTTLGDLNTGSRVNLERALAVGDRLGGHIVSGHVDAVGVVRERKKDGSALYLGVEVPREVSRLTAGRGSVTLAGVSLTVTDVVGDVFYVGLIPHTLAVTTLDTLGVGSRANVEADLIARYVERLLERGDGGGASGGKGRGLTVEFLKDKGFA